MVVEILIPLYHYQQESGNSRLRAFTILGGTPFSNGRDTTPMDHVEVCLLWFRTGPSNLLGQELLVGVLEHDFIFPYHILGISSSQLTNSIIFQRGRSTTNQIIINH